jgi:hypothetical protein
LHQIVFPKICGPNPITVEIIPKLTTRSLDIDSTDFFGLSAFGEVFSLPLFLRMVILRIQVEIRIIKTYDGFENSQETKP